MKIILSCYLGRSCARNIRGVSASPESTASGIEWRLLRFRMIIAQIFGAVKPSGYSSLTIEDGLSIVEIQFLLGHEQIETTMRYLDITTEDKVKALVTLESETEKGTEKKWKKDPESLVDFCGLKR